MPGKVVRDGRAETEFGKRLASDGTDGGLQVWNGEKLGMLW